jgi:hypothetical protein
MKTNEVSAFDHRAQGDPRRRTPAAIDLAVAAHATSLFIVAFESRPTEENLTISMVMKSGFAGTCGQVAREGSDLQPAPRGLGFAFLRKQSKQLLRAMLA